MRHDQCVLSGFDRTQPLSLVLGHVLQTFPDFQFWDKNEAKNQHWASNKNKTEAAEKALFFRLSP